MLLVSVIVPVYNAEKYLNKCLTSVLNQNYGDFELLLIDDGSTDGSSAICDAYSMKDSRIRVIHKENSGVSATRNVGLENATGEYILFVDADDYLESNMLESLLSKATETDSDIVMCNYFVQNGNEVEKAQMEYDSLYRTHQEIVQNLIYRFYTGDNTGLNCVWNKLIRRELYSKEDIKFNCNLKRAEDMWFVFECLKRADRVAFLNEAYYYYVQTPGSVMHTFYLDQFQQWKYTRRRLLEENQSLGFPLDMVDFYAPFLQNSIVFIKGLLKEGKSDLAIETLQDEFLSETVQYARRAPLAIHMKCLLYLAGKRKYWSVLWLMRIWNLL